MPFPWSGCCIAAIADGERRHEDMMMPQVLNTMMQEHSSCMRAYLLSLVMKITCMHLNLGCGVWMWNACMQQFLLASHMQYSTQIDGDGAG